MDSLRKLLNIVRYPGKYELNVKDIVPRPNAGSGIWLALLLPAAVIIGVLKNPTSSDLYQHVGVVSTGLLSATATFVIKGLWNPNKQTTESTLVYISHFLPSVIIATFMLPLLFNSSVLLSKFSGVFSTYTYAFGIVPVFKACPKCFTFGEASVILQAIMLFTYGSLVNFYDVWHIPLHLNDCIKTSTIILQVGWFGIGAICSFAFCFPIFRTALPFYVMSAAVLVAVVIPLLHIFLQASPILWILQLLVAEWSTAGMVVYWAACSVLAVLAVQGQIQGQQKASTVVRKHFHILALAVFIPGLVYQQCLLYLASGIVMALFIALELLRILSLPPWGSTLQDGFSMFADEKDQGGLSLTPLYLLGGCALPLWLHPSPSTASLLPLLSGVLAIGVGDTAASVCGTALGRHRWPGGLKTVEGTLGCILSQIVAVVLLVYFGFLEGSASVWVRSLVAIVIASLIEAKTDQVDNLALPLVMYSILV